MILPHYLSVALAISSAAGAAARCRCLYGQTCWPNEAAFSSLSSNVSQPLIHPVPPASACYPASSPSGNCSDVVTHYRDAGWRADLPGALQNPNFETFTFKNGSIDACYLNVTLGLPCGQGSVPPIGVDARTVEDVQAAVVFAKQHNLRLIVKNTGHDYLGRSAGRGGFLLWTHHLKNLSYDEAFVPQGAGSDSDKTFSAVTVGAGVQWHEAYTFVNQRGRVVVGGLSQGGTVGSAGGWVLGGGHSAIAPQFGLGVDNVIQFTVVLSDGSHVTTNAHQHPDLFWALRGGGGGTYAVVTSATYKTYPEFSLTMSTVVVNFSSPAVAQNVVTEFVRIHPKLLSVGWGGYSFFSNTNLQAFWVAPDTSLEAGNAAFQPFLQFVNATGEPVQAPTFTFPSYFSWYTGLFTSGDIRQSQVGVQVEIASRLLSKELAESDPANLAKIMLSIEGGVAANSVAGGAVVNVDPDSTGLNPSWRKALSEVYVSESWPEGTSSADIEKARQNLIKNTDILDKVTTDSGSYLNEGSLHERDFKKAFFGSHYNKLLAIKKKYDPQSLFVVASGVGSDEWDKDLQCRL